MALLTLALVSFVAWFVSMLAGGGSPLVLIPLVSTLFGASAIAPVITVGMLVGNVQRTLFFWRDVDWRVTLWHLPGTLVGSILGCYLLTKLDLTWLQPIIGLSLVGMAFSYWLVKQIHTFRVKAWYFLPLSFLNAFISGIIGSTGPILNPLYLNYGLVKEPMVATKAINVVMVHTTKLLVYLALGTFSVKYSLYGLVIGVASIPANWLGKLVFQQMTGDQFRHAVIAFVGVSGLIMLWQQRDWLTAWVVSVYPLGQVG